MDHVGKLVAENALAETTKMGQRGRLFGDIDLQTAGPFYVHVKKPKTNVAMIKIDLKNATRYFKVTVEEVF